MARWISEHELVVLGMATLPLLFPSGWTWLAATAIALTWLARWATDGVPFVATPLDPAVGVLMVTMVVGLWASLSVTTSAPKAWGTFLGIALLYGLASGVRTRESIESLGLVFLLVVAATAVLALIATDWEASPLIPLADVYKHIPRLIAGLPTGGIPNASERALVHPREVGGAMGMLLPFSLAMLLFGASGIRVLAAVTTIVAMITLLLSQTPNAYLGVVGALALFVGYTRPRLLVLSAAIATIVAVWLAMGPARSGFEFVLDPTNRVGGSLAGRLWLYRWALFMLQDAPLTGIGLNMFGQAIWDLYPDARQWTVYHAHNLYLQIAVDLGLPGLIAFVVLLLSFAWTSLNALRSSSGPTERAVLLGSLGGVLSYAVYGLLDAFTIGSKPGAAFWAMLGAALAVSRQDVLSRARHMSWRIWRGTAWVLLGAFVVAALSILLLRNAGATTALNLGTVEAHRILTASRGGEAVRADAVARATALLEEAEGYGATSSHSWLLLARLHELAGEYDKSIEYLGRVVNSHGDRPPDLPWITNRYRELYGYEAPDYAAYGTVPSWDADLASYRWRIAHYPTRWEEHLRMALLLDRQLGDREAAINVLTAALLRVDRPKAIAHYLATLR